MNTLKMFQLAVLITVLSVLTGCSDQLVTGGQTDNEQQAAYPKMKHDGNDNALISTVRIVKSDVRLKPGRSYEFNFSNTGLSRINGIDIVKKYSNQTDDVNVPDCSDLSVYSETTSDRVLDCHSNGLNSKIIIIKNTGTHLLDLTVTLTGKKNPESYDYFSE